MRELFIIGLVICLLKVAINQPDDMYIVESDTTPVLTYDENILPIIKQRCAVCHNSSVPERNWLDYKTTYRKRNSIKLRLENRTMPIGLTMLDSERQMMIDWVNQGAKK